MASHLLDTHVVLWLAFAERLNARSLRLLDEAQHRGGFAISAISSWEIAQLQARGRLSLKLAVHEWVSAITSDLDAEPLSINFEIGARSITLPGNLHRDPADRILVATARVHRLTLVTRDSALLAYAAEGHIDALAV